MKPSTAATRLIPALALLATLLAAGPQAATAKSRFKVLHNFGSGT